MLPIMLWTDDDEQKKKRLEKKLREKKYGASESELPDNAVIQEGSKEIAQQSELIRQQQEELLGLKHLLVEQNKMLKSLINSDRQPQVVQVAQNSQPSSSEKPQKSSEGLPILGDVDVKVIKTDNYETQGKVGEKTQEGQSVKDRVARLRELKKRGKE